MKTPNWFLKRGIIAWVLWPLSLVYNIVSKMVFIVRLFGQKRTKRPVICIGGLLAGGVGKTPVVREIAKRLDAPVVMRGYGAQMKNSHLVKAGDSANEVGDEAKMLSAGGLEVYIGDRLESIKAIDKSAIVLDDGFQNPTIKKDISVLVFDGKVGVGNGFVLPAGPLREPLWFGLARADAVIIIDDSVAAAVVKGYAKLLKKPVFFAEKEVRNPGLFGKVIPFAGIGYPEKFFDSIGVLPKVRVIETVSFPDHYEYRKQDFVNLFKLARRYDAELVCTEKDWVKFPENIKKKIKYMPLGINMNSEFWRWLDREIRKKKKDEDICK